MKLLSTLFGMLPEDVVINHISPYTYQTKPEKHLLDIRTFVDDLQMIEYYYLTMLNERVLLHDLLQYYKKRFGLEKIKTIYKKYFQRTPDINTKNRILLAKMNPTDRILFINDYILINDEL